MGDLVAVVEAESKAPPALAVRDDHVGKPAAAVGERSLIGRLISGVPNLRNAFVVGVLFSGQESLEVLLDPRVERRLAWKPVRARRDWQVPACGLSHTTGNRSATPRIPEVLSG